MDKLKQYVMTKESHIDMLEKYIDSVKFSAEQKAQYFQTLEN